MNITVKKKTGVNIQKELEKTEKHNWFNVTNPSTETINLSGRNGIKKNKFKRKVVRFHKWYLKTLFFVGITCFIVGLLIIIASSMVGYAEAKENKICKSEKCEARYNRIVTCQKYTKNKDDVLQCALWKTVFLKNDIDRHEKEDIKEELKELMERMVGNKKTVHHKNWDLTDKKQETLQKLYDEGVKQGVKNIPDMLGTFLGENGNLDMSKRSNSYYVRGGKKYWDFGVCQVSEYYHKKIVHDKRFFTDIDFQIENCVRLYKGGTKFYGKVHKEKMKKNLVFNQE